MRAQASGQLRIEPAHDLAGVHAGFENLEGHSATHGNQLLGEINRAEASFSKLFDQFVLTNLGPRAFLEANSRGTGDGGVFEKIARIVVRAKQSLDSGAQRASSAKPGSKHT